MNLDGIVFIERLQHDNKSIGGEIKRIVTRFLVEEELRKRKE